MAIDPRFLAESGHEVFTGNELLVKGALETEGGVHLLTGYPGSPVAGFFDILGDIARPAQLQGHPGVSGQQRSALRRRRQRQPDGADAARSPRSRASACMSRPMRWRWAISAGRIPQGGAVIIMGEDPWCDSTQVPADSRFLCEHLRMPVVEPGSPQQLKDWIDLSFKLSQSAGLYIGYIVTVAQADGGGSVDCRPNQFPTLNTKQKFAMDTQQIDLDKVLLPPRTWQRELMIPERFATTMRAARELGINRIIPASEKNGDCARAAGIYRHRHGAGHICEHVLFDLGLAGHVPDSADGHELSGRRRTGRGILPSCAGT